MVLLSPSLSLSNLQFFRNRASSVQSQKCCGLQEKVIVCSSAPSNPISQSQNGFLRRDLVLFGLSSSVSLVFPSSGLLAEEDLKMASMIDDINAYSYLYPVELPSKKFLFKWVESRKPERYSSAAPLSPDARLRIVSERVDIIDNLIISVSIGPPNFQLLKSKDKSTWSAKDVADSVLSDKSALVIILISLHELPQVSAWKRVQFLIHIIVKLMVNHIGIMNILYGNHLAMLPRNPTFIDIMLLQPLNEMVIFILLVLQLSASSGTRWDLSWKKV